MDALGLNSNSQYKAGDTLTFGNYANRFSASSNQAGDRLYFMIPMDQRVKANTTITFTITDYYFETSNGIQAEEHSVSIPVTVVSTLYIGLYCYFERSTVNFGAFNGGVVMINGTLTFS